MTIVQETLLKPGTSVPWTNAKVTVALVGPGFVTGGQVLGKQFELSDDTGLVSFDLAPTVSMTPAGCYYVWTGPDSVAWSFTVPSSGGPYTLQQCLISAPQNPGVINGGMTEAELQAALGGTSLPLTGPIATIDDTSTGSTTSTYSSAKQNATYLAVTAAGSAATKNVGTTTGTVAAGDDTRIVGATSSLRTYQRGEDAVSLGIPTDGTSDCTAAMNVIPANTGEVHLRGTFTISDTVILQEGVRFVGKSRGGVTTIQAAAGFAGTAMFDLGGGALVFDTSLEHLLVECNGRAAKGVQSTNCQEGSGLDHVDIHGYTSKGAHFFSDAAGHTPQNFRVSVVEFYSQPSTDNTVGLHLDSSVAGECGWARTIEDITARGNGGANCKGIWANARAVIQGFHMESVEAGLYVDHAGVIGIGLYGLSDVVDCVQIPAGAPGRMAFHMVNANGATHAINDLANTVAGVAAPHTYAGEVAWYLVGDGAVGARTVQSSAPATQSQVTGSLYVTQNLTFRDGFGAFAHAPVGKQTITGALSSVTDANAKAVLTSIISALGQFGLTSNGTS